MGDDMVVALDIASFMEVIELLKKYFCTSINHYERTHFAVYGSLVCLVVADVELCVYTRLN